jgi:2'-5' RNA ligase
MPVIRTFAAIVLPKTVKEGACDLIRRFQRVDATVAWVPKENLHLTLKFIGLVEASDLHSLYTEASAAVANFEPISVEYQGAGAFPDHQRPRSLWLGVGEGSDEISELHRAVEDAFMHRGIRREGRKYTPHVTLGRVRKKQPGTEGFEPLLEKYSDFHAGSATVKEVVIYSSELDREGPTYGVIGRAKLGGG